MSPPLCCSKNMSHRHDFTSGVMRQNLLQKFQKDSGTILFFGTEDFTGFINKAANQFDSFMLTISH